MAFQMKQKVLFRHCDPAGIVFYPRYFEMMNDCVEAFFDRVVGMPFEAIHAKGAVPTAQIETRFTAPSRHGDRLTLTLAIRRLGRASCSYALTATCAGELRFETEATLVFVGPDGRPRPWPEPIRTKLSETLEKAP